MSAAAATLTVFLVLVLACMVGILAMGIQMERMATRRLRAALRSAMAEAPCEACGVFPAQAGTSRRCLACVADERLAP